MTPTPGRRSFRHGSSGCEVARDDDLPFREHVEKMEPERVAEDVAAAVAWLRSLAQGSVRSASPSGSAWAGALMDAVGRGARAGRLRGLLRPSRPGRAEDPRHGDAVAAARRRPGPTPVSAVEAFAEQVRAAGVEAELHVYPTPPTASYRHFDEHREA